MAGSKVNVKFMVILGAVLCAVFGGVAFMFVKFYLKSAEDHIRIGDAAMQASDYVKAEREYGKAVKDQPKNPEFLTKWLGALERYTTESATDYRLKFEYMQAGLRDLALARMTDVEAHERYLNFLLEQLKVGANEAGWLAFESQVEQSLASFEGMDPGQAPFERLYRFRGIARAEQVQRAAEFKAERAQEARADLDRALAANPGDDEAALARGVIASVTAREQLRAGQADAAKATAEKAIAEAEAWVSANPQNAAGPYLLAQVHNDNTMRRARGLEERADREHMNGSYQRLVELVKAKNPGALTFDDIARVRQLEQFANNTRKGGVSLELIDAALGANASQPDLLMLKAQIHREGGELSESVETLAKVAALPTMPVSFRGLMLFGLRDDAVDRQSAIAFDLWEGARDEAGKAAALADLKKYNQTLKDRLPADAPLLLLSEARVLFADGKFPEARSTLVKYVDEQGLRDEQAYWILAQIANRNQNYTEAAERLRAILAIDGQNMRATVALAEILSTRLRRNPEAIALYTRMIPNFVEGSDLQKELIRRRDILVRLERGETGSLDPVTDAIVSAFSIYEGSTTEPGDPERAIDTLRTMLEPSNYDPRLIRAIGQIYTLRGDIAPAAEVLRIGLERHPDDPVLQSMKPLLTAKDATELSDMMIDGSELKPARKALAKWENRNRAGKTEEARVFLAEALAADPNDPLVIESVFRDALSRDDLTGAQTQVDKARSLNADGLNGLSFDARMMIYQGKTKDALDMLQRSVERMPDNVALLRLLAAQQLAAGQSGPAIDTYRRALGLRANDPAVVTELVSALVGAQRSAEALGILKDSGDSLRGRRDLIELRIDLESQVGDKDAAIAARRAIMQSDPANRLNRQKLASMLVDAGEFTEARQMINQLRAERDELAMVALDARWYAAQRDLEGGKRAFQLYISDLFANAPDSVTAEPFVTLGSFLLRYGDAAGGIEAFKSARRFEDAETLRVEKTLGEALRVNARYAEAAESFQRIVDAGKDDAAASFTKRLADAYTRSGQYDKAAAVIETLRPRQGDDASVLLLLADLQETRGDRDGARTTLDAAARNFAQTPGVFARRAQLLMVQSTEEHNLQMMRDAVADLNAALAIEASSPMILRMRGQAHLELGEFDAGFRDLTEAVRLNPGDDAFFQGVLQEMIRADRSAEAAALATQVATLRPGDPRVHIIAGATLALAGDWARSRGFYEQAWTRVKDKQTGSAYATVLLNVNPARYTEAREVLAALGQQVENDWSLLLSRSQIMLNTQQREAAVADATRAFRLVDGTPGDMAGWFNRTQAFFSGRDMVTLLDRVAGETTSTEWVTLFRGDALSQTGSESDWTTARNMLDQLIAGAKEQNVRRFALQSKSRELMKRKDVSAAVEVWRRGVEIFPDDWQMLNNLAYTLCVDLGQCAEAVEFARKAAEIAPPIGRPDILDTLGWTLYKSGQDREARIALEEALATIGRGSSRPVILLHLMEVCAAGSDRQAAEQYDQQIRRLDAEGIRLPERYRSELEDVRDRVSRLP